MDYTEIVIQGYVNENNREYLEKYFYREFKKAERDDFIEPDEFFSGCFNVVDLWIDNIKNQIYKRKKELMIGLNSALTGELKYEDLEGKTIEQKHKESIKLFREELKNERPDGIGIITFKARMQVLTNGRITIDLSYNQLLDIKTAIIKAQFKAKYSNMKPKPDKTDKPKGKGGRPEAKYKPIESYIISNPTYFEPKEIAAILKCQFKNGKAADLITMIKALNSLNIWGNSSQKEEFLMLDKDFNYKEGYENYRKAKSKEFDKIKTQIQKLITKK